MDINRPVESSPLLIECPHCGHSESDEFELFDDDQVQAMQCSGCDQQFHFAITECPRCGAEWQFSWRERPILLPFEHMCCGQHISPHRDHETASTPPHGLA